jgi:hypothetical protein
MKNLKILFLLFSISFVSTDVNLNELCRGILFQAIPHPSDRNLFIGCVQGRGTIFECDNPDHVFDPESVSCVDENLLLTTTEDPTPSTPSTTSGME